MAASSRTSKPIRVAFLVTHAELGGLQHYVSDLVPRLSGHRFEAEVVCSFAGPWLARLHQIGLRAVLLEMPPRFKKLRKSGYREKRKRPRWGYDRLLGFAWSSVPYVYRLARHLRRSGIHIVYNSDERAQILGGLAGKLAGIPAVWHIHREVSDGLVNRLCARLATSVVVLTKRVAAQAARFTDPQKVFVIYNGVDLKKFACRQTPSPLRDHLGMETDRPLLGMVGGLTPQKGQCYFLEAAALVKARIPDAQFVVVGEEPFDGDGGYKRELLAMCESLQLGSSVKFLGRREDIPAVMSALDLLAVPSLDEPFGRVSIEAMAMGKPVVGSRVGGIPEAIVDGETGLLVPPKDSAALASAMIWLLEHPQRARQMGEAGRQRVEQQFTLEKTVRDTESLMSHVINRRVERHPHSPRGAKLT